MAVNHGVLNSKDRIRVKKFNMNCFTRIEEPRRECVLLGVKV